MLNSQVWIDTDQFKRLKKISIAWAYLLRWGFERGGYFKNKEYYIKNRNSCIVGNAQFRQGIHTAAERKCKECDKYAFSLFENAMLNTTMGFKKDLNNFMTHFENEHQNNSVISKIMRRFK